MGAGGDEALSLIQCRDGVRGQPQKIFLSKDNPADVKMAAGIALVNRNVHVDLPKLIHGYNTCQAESSHNVRCRVMSKRVLQAKMSQYLSHIPTLISHYGELWVYEVLRRLGVDPSLVPLTAQKAITQMERVRMQRKEREALLATKKRRKLSKKIRAQRRADELVTAKARGQVGTYHGTGKGGRHLKQPVAAAAAAGGTDAVPKVRAQKRSKVALEADFQAELALPDSKKTVLHCNVCKIFMAKGSKAGHLASKTHQESVAKVGLLDDSTKL